MQHILEMVWFPLVAMVFAIIMTVWALRRDSRRRRAVSERTVVVSERHEDPLS